MIEKTGIIYSENSDLSNSQTIEQAGEQSSITVPDMGGTDFYVKAYCVESGITYESSVEHYVAPLEYFQINNEYAGTNTITLTTSKNGSPTVGTYATSVEYSKDGENWTTISLSVGTNQISLNQGEYVYLRNSNGYWNNYESSVTYYRTVIKSSHNFSVQGNIKTLLDYTSNTPLSVGCFSYLFQNATGLINTPDLEETTLSDYCYSYMFSGCTGITSTPTLPATTLAERCYSYMFSGCTGITSTPTLPATTLAVSCYNGMFSNCSGLTTAQVLPATTLAQSCYSGMFSYCTGITTLPSNMLPATTLVDNCYTTMFRGCSNLITLPSKLPATTLAQSCYSSMFSYCTNLTTIPSDFLPATTLANNCYQGMFDHCSSLVNVPSDLLPATTLAEWCYANMFSFCLALVTPPVLPATTLVNYCYSSMFQRSSSVSSCTLYAASGPTNGVGSMFDGVASSGTLYNYGNFNVYWKGPYAGQPNLPNDWTIVNS